MKQCPRCGRNKNLDSFNFKNKSNNTRASWCKDCTKESSRKNYESNRASVIARSALHSKTNALKIRTLVWEFLRNNPCIDCSEDDPMVLEFDHRVQSEKSFAISRAIHSGLSWTRIKNEIDKCDVRCANCHRRRTAIQLGWAKAFDLSI